MGIALESQGFLCEIIMMSARSFRLLLLASVVAGVCAAPATRGATPKNALDGTITLSNQQKLTGKIFMTREKMLRLFDPKYGEYRDFKLDKFSRITINCVRERIEREWYFKEEGNPEKIYTGRQYPRLDFTVTVTFKKGSRKLTSNIARGQPIYIQPAKGKQKRYILQPYLRGEMDQTLEQLVYMKEIVFAEPEDAKKKPEDAKTDTKTNSDKVTDRGT